QLKLVEKFVFSQTFKEHSIPIVVERRPKDKKEIVSEKCPNCVKDISLEDIKAICTNEKGKTYVKNDKLIEQALSILNKYRKKVGINSCISKAHFIAQICHETKFSSLEEDITYKWNRLLKIHGKKFKNQEEKEMVKSWYEDTQLSTEELNKKVASFIYRNINGNGTIESNDGWNYRARGFIQLTGRKNYRVISDYFNNNIKEPHDAMTNWEVNYSDVSEKPFDAMAAALAFWGYNNINSVAQNATSEHVLAVSKKIAGTQSKTPQGLSGRRYFFKRALSCLDTANCKQRTNYKKIGETHDGNYQAKAGEVYINVIATKDRTVEGPLIVFDDQEILFKTHSLCQGINGKRLIAGGNGETPTGRATTLYNPKAHKGSFKYGNHGLIYLTGESGEFLTATTNGRAGIAIHAGHTRGYYNTSLYDLGSLMNTFGCIRIYNEAMKRLGELYQILEAKGKTIYCYIEDYEGNIEDVYQAYDFDSDFSDVKRDEKTKTQQ
ncbi:L,D-transpeptidase family protein, partial [Myroides odoratus]|uniref:glycoside hydrolase family 19 protein n=1 Tax=Myroides odoratus TaxID=256 RepID=UPI0033426574